MNGLMGECPDWYAHLQIARYLGVSPWTEIPMWWKMKAMRAITAENEAREILNKRNNS